MHGFSGRAAVVLVFTPDPILCGVLGADAEPYDILVIDRGRNHEHVQLTRLVDNGKEHLVQLVGTPQTEANQTRLDFIGESMCLV